MTDDSNSQPPTRPDGFGGCDRVIDTIDLHAISGLTGFQRDVLLAIADLAGTEPSGSDVQSRLRECLRREVSHGRLYRNLRELHEEDYISKVPLDGRTYSYRLTDLARTRLVSYLSWSIECLDSDHQTNGNDPSPTGGSAASVRDPEASGTGHGTSSSDAGETRRDDPPNGSSSETDGSDRSGTDDDRDDGTEGTGSAEAVGGFDDWVGDRSHLVDRNPADERLVLTDLSTVDSGSRTDGGIEE